MADFHGVVPLTRWGGDLDLEMWRCGRRHHILLVLVMVLVLVRMLVLGLGLRRLLLLVARQVVRRASRRSRRDNNG